MPENTVPSSSTRSAGGMVGLVNVLFLSHGLVRRITCPHVRRCDRLPPGLPWPCRQRCVPACCEVPIAGCPVRNPAAPRIEDDRASHAPLRARPPCRPLCVTANQRQGKQYGSVKKQLKKKRNACCSFRFF